MIWVEILSRQREVAARFRVVASEVRIGRGYDNDVVIDDPYVAAKHLRVYRHDDGHLVAEDVGSANGTFLDGNRTRLSTFTVDGKQPIRIGQTYLHIRDVNHEVERERLAPTERHALPIVLTIVLAMVLVGIDVLKIWLTQTGEARLSAYLTPLLTVASLLLVWVGLWALLCRIFDGRAHFLRNLLIALIGTVAFSVFNEFALYAAYAWNWPDGVTYGYVAAWLSFAGLCFFHLREVGRKRLWLKGAAVVVLMAGGTAFTTLQQSEAASDFGRAKTAHWLLPPMLRAVPLKDEDTFFKDIGNLKARLDSDRSQAQPTEARL